MSEAPEPGHPDAIRPDARRGPGARRLVSVLAVAVLVSVLPWALVVLYISTEDPNPDLAPWWQLGVVLGPPVALYAALLAWARLRPAATALWPVVVVTVLHAGLAVAVLSGSFIRFADPREPVPIIPTWTKGFPFGATTVWNGLLLGCAAASIAISLRARTIGDAAKEDEDAASEDAPSPTLMGCALLACAAVAAFALFIMHNGMHRPSTDVLVMIWLIFLGTGIPGGVLLERQRRKDWEL